MMKASVYRELQEAGQGGSGGPPGRARQAAIPQSGWGTGTAPTLPTFSQWQTGNNDGVVGTLVSTSSTTAQLHLGSWEAGLPPHSSTPSSPAWWPLLHDCPFCLSGVADHHSGGRGRMGQQASPHWRECFCLVRRGNTHTCQGLPSLGLPLLIGQTV